MRISQKTMYNTHISNMQKTLSDYMTYNNMGATQKAVNKPSDDPAGMARIMMYRSSISDISQYQRNLDTAYGWLTATDQKLTLGDGGVTSILQLILAEAEQAATGTMTAENRLQIAEAVRGYLGDLMLLANSRYEGKSIFCGQDYFSSAFEMTLAADCYDQDFLDDLAAALGGNPPEWITFSGNELSSTALIRFPNGGTTGSGPIDYEYSLDGGKTWVTGIMTGADNEIDIDGVIMTIPQGVRLPAYDEDDANNTQMWVRPALMYQGADNDMVPQVVRAGLNSIFSTSTTGSFSSDIQIRFDTDIADWNTPQDFTYSYSTDGGITWVECTANTSDGRIVVPGGYLELNATGVAAIDAGTELTIKPQRTELDIQSAQGYLATANNVGKDIFGGQYMTLNADGQPVLVTAFDGGAENVFETVCKLIGYLETNNQDGIQQCLADLNTSMKTVTTYAAKIGGRLNALSVASETMVTDKDIQTAAMSSIEDIDLTELLIRLTQSQLAYSTVLKSSSMIMQLNLTQYI